MTDVAGFEDKLVGISYKNSVSFLRYESEEIWTTTNIDKNIKWYLPVRFKLIKKV